MLSGQSTTNPDLTRTHRIVVRSKCNLNKLPLLFYLTGAVFAVFACLVLIKTRREGGWISAGVVRRWGLVVAITILACMASIGPIWPYHLLKSVPPFRATVWLALANVFSSVVIVELLRTVISNWTSWSDARHGTAVGLCWVVMTTATTLGIFFAKFPTPFWR